MAKASTQSTKQKAIKSSLVKTGWICTTIPILVQVGLFATEFQLTKAAEQLAIAESYESQANDLIMRSNSLLTQSWAALLMRSARGQARSNSAIMQNVHQLRENISQLKAIPRQGSSEVLQTIVRELEGQVDILETNEKAISSQTSESHDLDQGGNFAAMMDRIHKLRKESIAGINMLGRMTRAMDDHRAELKRRQLEQHNLQEQVQQFITVALAVDVLLAIFIPLLFLKSLSSRVNLLIQNAEKLPTAAPLNRNVKGSDEIAFLNKVLCDAKDTLAATEEEKQLLVDMISHDIRSPLSSAELLIGEMSRKPDEADPERLKRLQAIFRRIGRLVTDMLELEKLESGAISLDLQAFDIAETIRSSVDAIQPQAASKQVAIQSNLKKREIIADPSRLSQVLDNLLSNAVKHSPKGGTVQVSMRTDQDGIYILVSDQGDGIQGISGGNLQKIFERQFQTEEGRAKGGYGLGLSICKQLITLHKGEISVQNQKPKGCLFTVFLPDSQDDFDDDNFEDENGE